jgi:hypothetical protein
MQQGFEVLWDVSKGSKRRRGCVRTTTDGAVEFQVLEEATVLVSSRHGTREPALVLAEELRQAYLADGWADEGEM